MEIKTPGCLSTGEDFNLRKTCVVQHCIAHVVLEINTAEFSSHAKNLDPLKVLCRTAVFSLRIFGDQNSRMFFSSEGFGSDEGVAPYTVCSVRVFGDSFGGFSEKGVGSTNIE